MIENKMLIDSMWRSLEHLRSDDQTEKLKGPGYKEIGTGIFVPEEDALDYAMERLSWDADLQKDFVEWFYSGNWIKED